MKKKVSILGSTGSVGISALRVIDAMPELFEVVLLAANRNREVLLDQARKFRPQALAIGTREDADWLRAQLPGIRIVSGQEDLVKLIGDTAAHFTLSAIVGAAGLKPTMAAIRAGSTLGLANKESMVIAGSFMNQAAIKHGVEILPIDSEHNALHQCLRGEKMAEVKRLILTASGGPFRTYEGDMSRITREQALNHPTWNMGPKITIDSATMMNKGLEVIEAHHLFGFGPDKIDIVVHPQSIVHSMIETLDGSYKCQLGKTDMCDPIQYALTWPERRPHPFEGLDITRGLDLNFYPVDPVRFPCIRLAYDALKLGGSAAAVLNAANEIAVQAFLDHHIRFSDIGILNERCLLELGNQSLNSLDEVLEMDQQTRRLASKYVKEGFSNT